MIAGILLTLHYILGGRIDIQNEYCYNLNSNKGVMGNEV